jgi:hypothetical protein
MDKLDTLRLRISDVLIDRIEPLFNQPYKLTLICRNPAYPDNSRDVLITNESSVEDAITAIRGLEKTGLLVGKKE